MPRKTTRPRATKRVFTRRLWRKDGMRWVMAPEDVQPGETWEWAQNKCRAVMTKAGLQYEDRK